MNDEILTVGYLFVASSQAGLSQPVISIFGEKSRAEIILSEDTERLVACQVRSGYCRLSWDAPEDDGGTPVQQFLINMMDLTVNEWVTAAETADKSVEIQGLKPGHLYRFEVMAVNKEGNSPSAKLKDPVKAENPYTSPGVPTDVNIVDFDENSVTLR